MSCRNRIASGMALVLTLIVCGEALSADPQLRVITPRGAQRGTEAEFVLRGSRLTDPRELLFYEPGFEVKKLEPTKKNNAVRATVKISPDCALGEHIAQLRCAEGITEFRTFWVGPFSEIAEKEPNNEFEKPQEVPLGPGTTVTGLVENEDVDHYVVEAKKGQRISAEIEGLRLGTQFNSQFDPTIAILDEKRFELVVADDTPLVHQDGAASIIAPKDGRYVILVRDSSYGGNGNCQYRLHIGQFPRPLAVYPAGGPAGKEVDVTLIGDPSGTFEQTITTPADPKAPFALIPAKDGMQAPSANPFRVSPFGNVLEQEPNNSAKTASNPVKSAPIALNGVLAEKNDRDFLRFKATKGQKLQVECYARRVRTPLDVVMSVHKADGSGISSNDDRGGPDPTINFTAPADGEYLVSIRDHLNRSGPGHVYRVEVTPQEPEMSLSIPRVDRYDQTRQRVVIPRDGRFATVVNASRGNFGGEIVLETEGLPKGVTMNFEPMESNINSMPVVFEAAADAPLEGGLADLKGFQKEGSKDQFGRFNNTADLLRYRNNLMLWTATVDRLAIGVVEKLPFSIKVVKPNVPLVRNGKLPLKVVAKRDEGFDKPITVEFPFRPPGVGTLPRVTIPEGKNEVEYPLNANGNAQIGDWKVFAVGYADVGGTGLTSSKLTDFEIAENNLTVDLERAATVQGESGEIFGTVNIKEPFEGTAKAELLGLPNKVTAESVEVTKDSKEVHFAVKTDAKSPVGRHKSIICQVTIPQDDEAMVHRAGTVELRIDEPPPEPKEKPKKTEKKPKKKSEKPLSRLEKLRLEAKRRMEANK